MGFLTIDSATAATALGLYFRISMWQSKTDMDGGDVTWVVAATYITVYVFSNISDSIDAYEMIRVVELHVTIIVSCVPGCVSSWRNILRETAIVTTLRSLISSSRASLFRSRESSRHTKSLSIRSSEADLSPKHEFELRDPRHKETGIIKTIKIQQTEV